MSFQAHFYVRRLVLTVGPSELFERRGREQRTGCIEIRDKRIGSQLRMIPQSIWYQQRSKMVDFNTSNGVLLVGGNWLRVHQYAQNVFTVTFDEKI